MKKVQRANIKKVKVKREGLEEVVKFTYLGVMIGTDGIMEE